MKGIVVMSSSSASHHTHLCEHSQLHDLMSETGNISISIIPHYGVS